MNTFTVRHLRDVDAFSACSEKWNRLWQRSFPAPVTVRSEGMVDWVQTFNCKADFDALVVESEGDFVSGIPLVDSSIRGLISAKQLAGNAWSNCGNLLLDRQVDPACLKSLVETVRERTNGLLSLNEVAVESPQWTAFLQAVRQLWWSTFPEIAT